MFQIGDIVLYNQTDVCRVQEIRSMPFMGRERIDYYVLKPVCEDSPSNSTVYVPVSADESRLHRAFSGDELKQMLDADGIEVPWTESPLIRKKEFHDILSRGQPKELLGLIRAIARRRTSKVQSGRGLTDAEEKVLLSAEKRLYPLFRCALNLEWNDFLTMVAGERALDLKSLSAQG